MQAVHVVGVVDTERRLYDGQPNYKFDACGTPQTEVGSLFQGEIIGQSCVRKLANEILGDHTALAVVQCRRIQLQPAAVHDAVRAAVEEERRLYRTDDGNAVFDVAKALQVAAGQCGHIGKHGNREAPRGPSRVRVAIEDRHRGCRRNESDGRDRADIVTAQVVFTTQIKAIERRNLFSAVTGDVSHECVKPKHVAAFIDLLEKFPIECIGDGVDVAADRSAGERKRIEIAFALVLFLRIVNRVVADGRRNRAGNDAVERAGSGETAVLNALEQQS